MKSVLLTCAIGKEGDGRNQLELTNNGLRVVFKGTSYDFPFELIHNISISPKKYIIPLVLGGIGTSFSMLALWLRWYHYELNLLLVFLFFGWMYYGFIGGHALVVKIKGAEHIFLLKANSAIVGEFVGFVKERMWKISRSWDEVIFHLTKHDVWDAQSHSYHYQHPSLNEEGFIHASDIQEVVSSFKKHFSTQENVILLVINPKWVIDEIRWEDVPGRGARFPHIYGRINKSSVLWQFEVEDIDGLKKVLEPFY